MAGMVRDLEVVLQETVYKNLLKLLEHKTLKILPPSPNATHDNYSKGNTPLHFGFRDDQTLNNLNSTEDSNTAITTDPEVEFSMYNHIKSEH